MTLRVVILRFDRLTPSPDDVEEVTLEASGLAIDVGEVGPCVELRKESVRAIQTLEGVAIASLQAIQLGELARNFRREEQVLTRVGEIDRVPERFLGGAEVARLAEDDAVTLLDLADRLGVLCLFGDNQRAIACLTSLREFLPRDPEDGEVDLEDDAHADVADLLAEGNRLLVRTLGRLPSLHARVEHAEVVQRNADVLRESEGAIVGEARLVVPERLLQLTADVAMTPRFCDVIAASLASPARRALSRALRYRRSASSRRPIL